MLDAGDRLLKSYTQFRERWFKMDAYGYGVEPMPFAHDQIMERLKDIHIVVDPKDYFDLKEPIVHNVFVELPSGAARIYRDMEKKFFAELDSGAILDANTSAARSQKLLQISSGAAYIDDDESDGPRKWRDIHDEKIEALRRIISEAAGNPVLVAYYFKFDIERLGKAFPEGRFLGKDSGVIDDWNAGKIPILFAHPKSAGHGINLQDGGNILVFFGIDWNLEDRLQIIERIGPVRQIQSGYDRPVYIYNILSNTSIDTMVMERVESKRSVQDILLEAMKTRTD